MSRPLEGIKVIDLTYHVAGPATSCILGDWGADVFKIEPPFGEPGRPTGLSVGMPADDGINPYYGVFNTNKRAIALNLKSEEGKQILDKMLSQADAMVTSFRPGALKRMGFDYESVHKRHPHIVYASVTGYGEEGPDKDAPGYDTVAYWARSGAMLDLVDSSKLSPLNPIFAFGDSATACSLAGGVAAGLVQKLKTGKGCKVMVSLYGQALYNVNTAISSSQFGDKLPRTRLQPATPMANSYECKDGTWIMSSLYEERRYPDFLRIVANRPDLAENPDYNTVGGAKKHTEELVAILAEEFAKRTGEEMVQLLTENDFAFSLIRHVTDAIHDPQAIANGNIAEYTHRGGKKTMMVTAPVKFDTPEVSYRYDYPLCGEHTVEILKEFGYDNDEEIKRMSEEGVIYIRP